MKLKNKLLITIIFVLILIGIKTKVQAKSYYIDDMKIQATIRENGDLQVEQTLKYVFNGDYNGIYITIPTKYQNKEEITSQISDNMYNAQGVQLQSVSLIDNYNNEHFYKKVSGASNGQSGVYTEENMYNIYKLKVYSPSSNTEKIFKIKYILQNVCVAHDDVGELYYNFIGGDWQCSIKNLKIDVLLPNNQQDIKIWGHGPDNGISEIVNNKHATFKVTNVATGKYVAARIMFDKSNIPNAQKKSNINAFEKIYQDEQKIAKISDSKKEFTRNIIIFSLALLVYWIILLIKYEKDKKIELVQFSEDELFKKYNPMLAGCLQGSRDILARDIIAVILNLIEKDNIKLEIKKSDSQVYAYSVSKNKEKESEMDTIEMMVYNWLFEDKYKLELSQRLKDMTKENDANEKFKRLNEVTQEKLNKIGANKKGVPVFIRVVNTFLFFISVYLAIKHVLYEGLEIYNNTDVFIVITIFAASFFPMVMLLIYGILSVIIGIRRKVTTLINKITGQRVVTTTVSIILIFLVIILITAIVGNKGNMYIIADEILLCISLIIMLTDNLMMKNSVKMIEDFSKINGLKEKIENYTMMEDRDIEQVTLWGKYLAYAVSFGIAEKISKRIKGLYLDDDLLNILNDKEMLEYINTDYSLFYYNASVEARFMKNYGKAMSKVSSGSSSGGGFSSRRRWQFLWWWWLFWRRRFSVEAGGAF